MTPSLQLDGWEYQAWHDYGRLPERLHAWKAAELAEQYAAGDLSLAEFEEELETAMGL